MVVELGEESFNSFSELFVSPSWRFPILLIQPIRDFQSDIGDIEKILLYLSTEISFVGKSRAYKKSRPIGQNVGFRASATPRSGRPKKAQPRTFRKLRLSVATAREEPRHL